MLATSRTVYYLNKTGGKDFLLIAIPILENMIREHTTLTHAPFGYAVRLFLSDMPSSKS